MSQWQLLLGTQHRTLRSINQDNELVMAKLLGTLMELSLLDPVWGTWLETSLESIAVARAVRARPHHHRRRLLAKTDAAQRRIHRSSLVDSRMPGPQSAQTTSKTASTQLIQGVEPRAHVHLLTGTRARLRWMPTRMALCAPP